MSGLSIEPLEKGHNVLVSNCAYIEYINFPNLTGNITDTGGYGDTFLVVSNCPNIKQINTPNLKFLSVYQNVVYAASSNIEEIYLPNFERFRVSEGAAFAYKCHKLKRIYIPKYNGYSRFDCVCAECNSLEEIIATSLTTLSGSGRAIGGYRELVSLPKLKKVVLSALTDTTEGAMNNSNRLIHLEIGSPTKVSLLFNSYNPTEAITIYESDLIEDTDLFTNNMQQFLYNFRTYIINRLFDYTGGAKHTITLHSNVHNVVLGLDESGYANTFYMPGEQIDYVTSLNQKLSDINWGLAYV